MSLKRCKIGRICVSGILKEADSSLIVIAPPSKFPADPFMLAQIFLAFIHEGCIPPY